MTCRLEQELAAISDAQVAQLRSKAEAVARELTELCITIPNIITDFLHSFTPIVKVQSVAAHAARCRHGPGAPPLIYNRFLVLN